MSLSTSCVFKSSVFLCSLSCRCDIPSCCVYSCLLVCSSSSLLYVLFATYQVIKLSFITLWGIVYKYKNIVYFYSSLIKAKTRLNIQCAKKKEVFFDYKSLYSLESLVAFALVSWNEIISTTWTWLAVAHIIWVLAINVLLMCSKCGMNVVASVSGAQRN